MGLSDPSQEDETDVEHLSTLLHQNKIKEAKCYLRSSNPKNVVGVWSATLAAHTRTNSLDTNSIYWDTVDTCFGGRSIEDCDNRTPGCIDSMHTPSYDLDKEGRAQVCRLVTCLAYNSPDVPYCPLLFPSAALLRRRVPEEDCFAYLCMMLDPPTGYTFFTQSKKSWDVFARVIKPLAYKYIKKHITLLERTCGRDQVDAALTGWVWWLFECLPLHYIERILTSFLLEGHKILFRSGLALLKLFSKQVAKSNSETHKNVKANGIDKELPNFCCNLAIPVDELLEVGFKIQWFSRSDILKITLKLEMELKSRTNIRLEDSGRRRSNVELLDTSAAQHVIAVSDTLSYQQLNQLWCLIPERITMVVPKLVFSSNEHGTSLQTFYNRCNYYEPTILTVRTTDGQILGAYCSAAWNVRHENDEQGLRQRYFGTGETFLFKFSGETVQKYAWVGEDRQDVETGAGRGNRAEQLFMGGDDTMVTVGGGNGTGLYLDENLQFGRTETCQTFNNPPLANEKDFTVSVVEVFGFNNLEW